MEENNVNVNENVQNNNEAENAGTQVEIQQPGTGRKILKWIVGGVVVVASFVGGIFTGRAMSKDDDDNSSVSEEGPKED